MEKPTRFRKPARIAALLGAMMLALSGSAVAQSGPCLQVGPDTLNYYFNACADPSNWQGLDSQFVMVSNCGDGMLNWTMSSGEPWVVFEPTSGGNFDSVMVYIDPGSMPPVPDLQPGDTALFGAILTVEDSVAENSPQYVAINLYMYCAVEGYTLGVYPSSFNYTSSQNQTLTGAVNVYEMGGANIEFQISNFTNWLILPQYFTPPITPDSVPFTIVTDGLAPGTYYDSIMVSTLLEAWNSPTFIPVTLTVVDSSGYTLATSLAYIDFTLNVGESMAAESLHVYETSGANIEFWTYNYSDWLYVDTVWGEQVTPATIMVVASASGLSPGVYGDSLMISAYEAETIVVPVSLTIEGSGGDYSILTTPQSLDMSLFPGSAESTSLEVYEEFGRLVWFEVNENSPWLGVFGEPPLVTPTMLNVVFDASDLSAGFYHDSIHIYPADDTMLFDPVAVPVTLTVLDGMPDVHALPDNFEFSIEYGGSIRDIGTFVYEQSGMSVPFSVQKQNNSAWLQVQDSQGWVTPDSVHFDIFMAGYEPGQYADTLIIFNPLDDTLWYEPVYIPIVVTLTDDPGEYVVEASPYYLDISLAAGGFRSDTIHVHEVYGHSVPFMFWNREPWLFIDTFLDSIPPYYTPLTLHLYTDASSLSPGYYIDTIFIYPDSIPFEPAAVPVFLTVTGDTTGYVVETTPTSFEVTLNYGEFVYDSLYVYEVYDRHVPFTFDNDKYWVFIEPLGMPPYSTPYMLTVVIDSDTLSAGTHVDTIRIYPGSRGMPFAPVSVPVAMTVVSGTVCGDADGSGRIDIDDIVTMINHVFGGGALNVPTEAADVDCDGVIIIDDIVIVITYIFMGGPPPCDGCS